jgi:hypothetical protein
MNKPLTTTLWLIGILLLIANFVALVIALTDIIPESPLRDYGFIIGLSFIVIGGFMRQAYFTKKEKI